MKIKGLLAAVMLAIGATASAQYYDSNKWNTTYHELDTNSGWSTMWVEYNPVTIKYDIKGTDDLSCTAFSLGYSQAFPIAGETPLFLEGGFGVQWTFKSKEEYGVESDFNMWSAKVPINLLYRFQVSDDFAFAPFAGVTARLNLSAQEKVKMGGSSNKINLFDKDDMGGSDYTWNRFQVGWQAGVKAFVGQTFMVGASYGLDFMELAKKTKMQTITVTVGYTF